MENSGLSFSAAAKKNSFQAHMFIGIENYRVRAHILVERRTPSAAATLDLNGDPQYSSFKRKPVWAISVARTCREHRRQGWMKLLIPFAADKLNLAEVFAWLEPFSQVGKELVRSFSPESFTVCK